MNSQISKKISNTQYFKAVTTQQVSVSEVLEMVYQALSEKGYNPLNQIVGYILTEDPTYITNYKNARTLISHLDRDELLQELVRSYLNQ